MNKLAIGISTFLSVLLSIILFSIYQYYFNRTGYIQFDKVYETYEGKKVKEAEMKKTQEKQIAYVDSLRFFIENLQVQVEKGGGQALKDQLSDQQQRYSYLVEKFSESNQKESQKEMARLVKEINDYVRDYGKEHHYKYIYGAMGDGSLMYARDVEDLSDDITKYLNAKYVKK